MKCVGTRLDFKRFLVSEDALGDHERDDSCQLPDLVSAAHGANLCQQKLCTLCGLARGEGQVQGSHVNSEFGSSAVGALAGSVLPPAAEGGGAAPLPASGVLSAEP